TTGRNCIFWLHDTIPFPSIFHAISSIYHCVLCTVDFDWLHFNIWRGWSYLWRLQVRSSSKVLAEPVGMISSTLFSFFQLVFQAPVCKIAVGGACERGRILLLIHFTFLY
ncbi:hypothetical protein BDU57DRAFT_563791, partial [Ampelomyces quisqualis]